MSKKQFKAESKRLLDLMINSIYTHKEIFLREMISNASDAIDKLNYKSITDPGVGLSRDDFKIQLKTNKDLREITVSDNGIGMNREDMENNLGVIAHSGSLDFKKALDEKADSEIIGQFGVGFYSAFMVADKVTVISKAYGSDIAYRWESSGTDGYSIKECEKDTVGTDVIMHIKPDSDGEDYSIFLDSYEIRELVKKYSDYIRWPVHMDVESGKWQDTGEKDEKGEPKREYMDTIEDKIINSMIPIWQRSKNDADDAACFQFYKDKFHDYDDPLSVIRVNAEGTVSYKAMLFIPSKAPYDFYSRDFKPGLQLYSNGVMIMENCSDLLPYCFRFVKGIVDSPDFSLNISREVLQHDRQLQSVSSNLKKKIKNELSRIMKDEPDKYNDFYGSFGLQLKYGVVEDFGSNMDILKDLIMFYSASMKKNVSLDEYIKAMPEGQEKIYYAMGDTAEHASRLPQTEPVREKGYDILCMTDDVDTFVIRTFGDFDGKKFCDVTSEDLGLESEEDKKKTEEQEIAEKDLLDFVKGSLEEKVSSVKLSHKLKNHAVFLTTQGNVTLEMERYFQNFPGQQDGIKATRVLEINGSHPAFEALKKAYSEDKDRAVKLSKIMYYQACIIAGVPLDDTSAYSEDVFSLF